MFAYNASPPDPDLVGERWREMWQDRIEHSGLWLETWLQHQRKDEYWRHGSINEDYSDIEVPVFAVSGWADRKSTRLNSSHVSISYAVFCLKKKKKNTNSIYR